MKKTILAGLLLATFSTSFMSANTKKLTDASEEKFCCWFATSYETKQEGSCTVTYKVVTKYFLCCPLGSTRSVYSKSCAVIKSTTPTTPSTPTTPTTPGNPTGSNKHN